MSVTKMRAFFTRLVVKRPNHMHARRGQFAFWRLAVVAVAGVCLALLLAGSALAQSTGRVSVSSSGVQGNNESVWYPSISADGRYVAFTSEASNLVAGDTNGTTDVFVHDRQTGTTTRVSVSSSGVQGDEWSIAGSISADGRYVAFISASSNLVTGDTNDTTDVFVHDRQTGTTTRVSVSSSGVQGDGCGDDWGFPPSLSADGRYVAFTSYSDNLVTGDTNWWPDIFVHDCQTGTTTRESVSSSGVEGSSYSRYPSLSADGRYVAFTSHSDNLVTGDTNDTDDIFVHDRQTGVTTRVNVSSAGVQGNKVSFQPSISADGRHVAFISASSNLVTGDTNDANDIFVHDLQTGTTTRASVSSSGVQGNSHSYDPSISADGRYVAFMSASTNLVTRDTNGKHDVFVHDGQTGTTTRVSGSSSGLQGNGECSYPALSANGPYAAFASEASNLVTGDTNGCADIFVAKFAASPVPPIIAPALTLKLIGLKHGAITLGKRVTVKGTVTPTSLAGSKLTLIVQKKGARWVRVKTATATILATGAYGWKYKATKQGAYRVRATMAKTATSTAAKTPWRTFRVR